MDDLCIRLAAALAPDVEIDPGRRSGRPVLKGRGFTLAQLLAEIADRDAVREMAEDFDLDPELVKRVLNRLSALLDRT